MPLAMPRAEPYTQLSGVHILVAEDNLFNLQVVSEFLEHAGAIVCVARNGQEALDLLKKDHFDCVLMDMRMPVIDGLEATRLIRANHQLAGLPVIAMTANVSREDRELCIATGMNEFIGKPFEPDDLYNAIVRCLSAEPAPIAEKLVQPSEPDCEYPLIDFSVLARLFVGDERKMHEFALKFLQATRLDMAEVDAALARYDLAALSTLGHHIRGAARMAGAGSLVFLCKMLETDSRDGETPEQLQEIVAQMHQTLAEINAYLISQNCSAAEFII